MNRTRFIFSLPFLLLFVLGLAGTAFSQSDSEAVKARMAKRLKAVDAARAAGSVGENNRGFLTAKRKLSSADQALVSAENADRKLVYTMIAKKTGESVAVVGKKRAASLRKLSKPGLWLQDTKGTWYRKQ